ncbi:maleylpyruvate isomerase family mycothiol-dependent enzyme [Nocardiopsis sp. NPDC057823]|uniref:maleylpyruvate isomerase family mycothiol-dependent enzyme n=1 Tax=Nocardiopsis sp. NPDC057823 TaxID=3346256 RepID=UPI00366D1B9C
MDIPHHIDALAAEGRLLAEAAERAGLDAPVPTCPGWTVRDLLAHTGRVHRWAASHVASGNGGPPPQAAPDGHLPQDARLLAWFREGHAALVATLTGAAPDTECFAFLPAPSPLAFWARRQCHETTVHRIDAQSALRPPANAPDPAVAPEVAADGVDELLMGFLARPGNRPASDPPLTLAVRSTDTGHAWTAAMTPQGSSPTRGDTDAPDAVLAAPAAELYPVLWNRAEPGPGALAGDRRALKAWRGSARVG